MTFTDWAARHPHAAAELYMVLGAIEHDITPGGSGKTEAWSQQQARFNAAAQGALAWRNNVGATPSKCHECNAPLPVIRYGLANDSSRLNSQIKSSDLILAIPRIIQPQDIGKTIAQFGAIETKRPGWRYTGKEQETGQAAWLALVNKIGGYGCFSTGEVKL